MSTAWGFEALKESQVYTTLSVIYGVKLVGENLPDAYFADSIPQVGELDELETFVGSKNTLIWLWTAVYHFKQGILGWVLGDHSAKTFEPLWTVVATWKCYFYITDGWSVYPGFIPDGDQIVSKTADMTRVEAACRRTEYSARRTALEKTRDYDTILPDCIERHCVIPNQRKC